MSRLFCCSVRRAAQILAAGVLFLPMVFTQPAHAWWVRGWGWPGPVVVAPPAVVVPPPVVAAAPPPVVVAPYPRARWVPAHYDRWGRWIPAHWT